MKIEIIHTIIELAIVAYQKHSTPSEFAKAAAHKAAFLAASEHHAELADFATLTAATVFYIEASEAIHFSARVTDRATDKLVADQNYRAEWQDYSTTSLPSHIRNNFFGTLAESSDKVSLAFKEAIAPTYEITSVLDVVARNKAKRAAMYLYRDTYATTRSAYIRALFIANQALTEQQRFEQFKKEITTRLIKDLSYDVIEPSIFLKILASTPLRIITGIIFFLAMSAIVLAAFHITSIPFVPLICTGSAVCAVSLAMSTGSIFAKKRCSLLEEENGNRAEVASIT